MIKGHYETALDDDDDVIWEYENGQDFLCFLIVSLSPQFFIVT